MKVIAKTVLAGMALTIVPLTFGQTTVSMTMTGAGSNIFDGVYIGPYTATVNGVSTQVICDDYADDTYLNESWTANVSDYSSLSYVKFDQGSPNQQFQYNEVAWLAEQLLNPSVTCKYSGANCAADIQFAIWNVFDPAASNGISTTSADGKNIADWLSQAASQTYTAGEFSKVYIFTPNLADSITCSGGKCPTAPPQEFIFVDPPGLPTPEPPSLAVLGADLSGVGLLVFVFARMKRKSQPTA